MRFEADNTHKIQLQALKLLEEKKKKEAAAGGGESDSKESSEAQSEFEKQLSEADLNSFQLEQITKYIEQGELPPFPKSAEQLREAKSYEVLSFFFLLINQKNDLID